MRKYVCEVLKLCVNSDCIPQTISAGKEKVKNTVKILNYSVSVFLKENISF